jgi:hypothetical protein
MSNYRSLAGQYTEEKGVPVYKVTPFDIGKENVPQTVIPTSETLVLKAVRTRRYTGTSNTVAWHKRDWSDRDCASNRLIKYGMIPYNSLEVSKNQSDEHTGTFRNVMWVRWAEYWGLSRDPSYRGYVPVDEYFMALEKCTDLEKYIRLLALWEMTGASDKPFYVDSIFPELDHHFVYRGFPDSVKLDDGSVSVPDPEYVYFWERYWNAVLGFIDLAQHELLSDAIDMLTLKRQYDLQALIASARYMQKKVQSYGQPLNNVLEYYMGEPFELKVMLIGDDSDSVMPTSTWDDVHRSGKIFWFFPQNISEWYTFSRRLRDFSTPFTVGLADQMYVSTVAQMLRLLWEQSLTPYFSQLEGMLAQIDYIGKPDNLLTEADFALIKDYDKNLFLRFAVDQSIAKGYPVFEQGAVAPVLERYASQIHFIEQPQLKYMQKSFLAIPETAAKFEPKYSMRTKGGLPDTLPEKSNLLVWLLAGGAAAGAYYLSQR